VLVDDATIRELNRDFRKKDVATDVLSFTLADGPEDEDLGEVVISAEHARDQATRYGHGLKREIAFLAVHGVLHLLGLDHGTAEEERTMTRLQEEVLADLGITR